MHLWIDGQCFQTASNVRGIGRYVANLLGAMAQTGEVQCTISLNGNLKEETIAARNYLKRVVPSAEIQIWYGLAHNSELLAGYSQERMTDESILAAHVNAIAPDIALSPSPFEGSGDRSSPFLCREEIEALTFCIFHDAIPYRFATHYLRNEATQKAYYRRFRKIDLFDFDRWYRSLRQISSLVRWI